MSNQNKKFVEREIDSLSRQARDTGCPCCWAKLTAHIICLRSALMTTEILSKNSHPMAAITKPTEEEANQTIPFEHQLVSVNADGIDVSIRWLVRPALIVQACVCIMGLEGDWGEQVFMMSTTDTDSYEDLALAVTRSAQKYVGGFTERYRSLANN